MKKEALFQFPSPSSLSNADLELLQLPDNAEIVDPTMLTQIRNMTPSAAEPKVGWPAVLVWTVLLPLLYLTLPLLPRALQHCQAWCAHTSALRNDVATMPVHIPPIPPAGAAVQQR